MVARPNAVTIISTTATDSSSSNNAGVQNNNVVRRGAARKSRIAAKFNLIVNRRLFASKIRHSLGFLFSLGCRSQSVSICKQGVQCKLWRVRFAIAYKWLTN
uniref:Uncharacterized protein n=1 Tax=Parascaris equorum TaxID=6256 RepID=A0A914R2L4_PAREQ